jgi:chorismate mutase
MPGVTDDLANLRREMDAINLRLVATLHERAALCRRIAFQKRGAGLPAVDAEREAAMLATLIESAPADGFATDALARVLRAVFDASRELVTNIVTAPER